MTTMVRFTAATGAWLAPIGCVIGVRPADEVRSLPDPADDVAGVIDQDGQAIPVVRLLDSAGRHVLLVQSESGVVGVLVAEALGVVDIDPDSLNACPNGQRRRFVDATHGAGDDLAYVLDPAALVRMIPTSKEMT